MQSSKTVWIFVFYGFILCCCGLLVASFGHGTYTLLGLAGAPFSAFGIPFAILASLAQWGLLALLMQRWERRYAVGFLLLHYIVAALLLSLPSSEFGDWRYVRQIPQMYQFALALGFSWYFIGQMLLWKVVVVDSKTSQ
jgi:hypothetical protein